MKKVLIFLSIVVIIFIAVAVLNNQATKDDYANTITPAELEEKLKTEGTQTVYFYSPECSYCQQTTPIVVPLTEDLGIDLKMFDVLKYGNESTQYNIESTPTIVHFENGQEVARIIGYNKEEDFKQWFEQHVLD